MPLTRVRLYAFVIVLIFTTPAWAQSPHTVPPADLDAYVASSMKTFDVPGMAASPILREAAF